MLREEESVGMLAALQVYDEQHGGRLHDLLTSPEVAAHFSNWLS